jgi:hypothetical protein
MCKLFLDTTVLTRSIDLLKSTGAVAGGGENSRSKAFGVSVADRSKAKIYFLFEKQA